ncbi:MAG: LPS translocon maturation chaperone LptM [Alphaproteobacteria bacterium]
MRIFILLIMVCALAMPLTACGKKGSLEQPPGTKKSAFPGNYPR